MQFADIPSNRGMLVPQGVKSIATEQSRANTAYGVLTTPDEVPNVELPNGGLIVVAFQAMWKCSVIQAANAAIFIDNTQLVRAAEGSAAPTAQTALHGVTGSGDVYSPLGSYEGGLQGVGGTVAYTGDLTTGQLVGVSTPGQPTFGGPVHIFAAAGTYTVGVRFKATSGSVTAKNRKLWVWTMEFPVL